MKGKFTFADKNTNFADIKEKGILGVIINNDEDLTETVTLAKDYQIDIIINIVSEKKTEGN